MINWYYILWSDAINFTRSKAKFISVNTNEDYILAIQNTEYKFLQYFIIEKKSDLIYAPFDRQEYLQKREELGVPQELQLKK